MKINKWNVLAVLIPLALCSGEVFAGVTITGNTCFTAGTANNSSALQMGSNGLLNQGAATETVICPVHVDHQLPLTVSYRVYMYDRNPTAGQSISCFGSAFNQDGNTVGAASPTFSSNAGSWSGAKTGTATLPSQAASYTYAIQCSIPGVSAGLPSGLGGIRVF